MNPTERRERFRAVLEGDQCVYPPVVYDPISARIAEDLGFELAVVTNPGIAASVLGAPEGVADVVLTSSEMIQQVRRICRASSISVMVSTHQGYGNALNVMHAVQDLENAGVSGLAIEDTVQPLSFGSAGRPKQLISLEEAVGKLKAAIAARQDPSLVILGATRAMGTGGVREAIRRVKAFEKTGVDAIHISHGETEEGIAAVHAATRLPLLVHSRRGIGSKRFLIANGVRIVVAPTGNLPLFAAMKAMYDILKAVRSGAAPAKLRSMQASLKLRGKVLRKGQYDQWIKDFLD